MCCSYSGSDWESRPLQSGPALAAARDVLYLLPLQELLERAIQLPQERFTQVETVIICFGVNVRGISKCKYTFLGSSCAMHNTPQNNAGPADTELYYRLYWPNPTSPAPRSGCPAPWRPVFLPGSSTPSPPPSGQPTFLIEVNQNRSIS